MTEVQSNNAEVEQSFGVELTMDEQNEATTKAAPLVEVLIASAPNFGLGVKRLMLNVQGLLLALSSHTGPEAIIDLLQNSTIPALQNFQAELAALADQQADTTH